MEQLIKNMTMKAVANLRVSIDQLIEQLNNNSAIMLDIRYKNEVEKWKFPFSLEIPINELPEKLSQIPKDKVIICACPHDFRSNIACQYLNSIGYNAKVLVGGLLGLADRLRGGAANDLKI